MDAAITPPLRVQLARVQGISPSAAMGRMHDFLAKYESRRAVASHGGDSAISAQLQKLTEALSEERAIRKKLGGTKEMSPLLALRMYGSENDVMQTRFGSFPPIDNASGDVPPAGTTHSSNDAVQRDGEAEQMHGDWAVATTSPTLANAPTPSVQETDAFEPFAFTCTSSEVVDDAYYSDIPERQPEDSAEEEFGGEQDYCGYSQASVDSYSSLFDGPEDAGDFDAGDGGVDGGDAHTEQGDATPKCAPVADIGHVPGISIGETKSNYLRRDDSFDKSFQPLWIYTTNILENIAELSPIPPSDASGSAEGYKKEASPVLVGSQGSDCSYTFNDAASQHCGDEGESQGSFKTFTSESPQQEW
ncbi:hypothetical protein WOLCODRAFT_154644 [Wolfiporia cocos MD-104 SS10]|uniref:Uncharacterized protein n=1 Tax=Wolfiporia cocos (strain MD-104) TaxID=742152 RepID=A0A2H3K6B1_WOLCO|nr:hypothetical protein WOLCODRAFT_154644 [Wolfiporia cocos MD-104 SS10]